MLTSDNKDDSGYGYDKKDYSGYDKKDYSGYDKKDWSGHGYDKKDYSGYDKKDWSGNGYGKQLVLYITMNINIMLLVNKMFFF